MARSSEDCQIGQGRLFAVPQLRLLLKSIDPQAPSVPQPWSLVCRAPAGYRQIRIFHVYSRCFDVPARRAEYFRCECLAGRSADPKRVGSFNACYARYRCCLRDTVHPIAFRLIFRCASQFGQSLVDHDDCPSHRCSSAKPYCW